MRGLRKGEGASRRHLPNGFGDDRVPAWPPPNIQGGGESLVHSCNCRFSSSISSASAVSVLTRFSIFRTACSTVV